MSKIDIQEIRDVGLGTKQLIINTPTNYKAKWFTINITNLAGKLAIDVLPEGELKGSKSISIPE